jgi:superfamily I DNA/RNA helicase
MRSQLETELNHLPLAVLPLSQRVKKPHLTTWTTYREKPRNAEPTLTGSTIHNAKGLEFDTVLLALATKLRKMNGLDVPDECAQGLNCEARRVLYMGASRTKRVLAIGAGPHAHRVGSIMRERDVPVELR